LFGHHHAAASTLGSRASDAIGAIVHLPIEVWLTAIPVAGGLAIAYVTYLLNLRRDRLALRDDAARRRVDEERLARRVYADLAVRLARYREALRRAARGGDRTRVTAEFDGLMRRATETDVIDVLGKQYLPFMSALEREESALTLLAAQGDGTNLATQVDRETDVATRDAALDAYARLFAPANVAER
jgi:hypothetical protein